MNHGLVSMNLIRFIWIDNVSRMSCEKTRFHQKTSIGLSSKGRVFLMRMHFKASTFGWCLLFQLKNLKKLPRKLEHQLNTHPFQKAAEVVAAVGSRD